MSNKTTVWHWLRTGVLALALVALAGACDNPTAPRVPTDDPSDDDEPKDPDGQGLIVDESTIVLV